MCSKKNFKMFPWMQYFSSHAHAACFSGNTRLHEDVIQCLYREASSEISNIVTEKNFERGEKLCEVLSAYILYMHRSNITFNEEHGVPNKSFIMLMSCLVDLHVFLCTSSSSSFHLKNCISHMFLFIGNDLFSLWDMLLHCRLLKKKYSAVLLPIMKRVMQGIPETVSNSEDYMRMILLMRHWKLFTDLKEDKYEILSLALKVTPPGDLLRWLSKLRIKGLRELPFSSTDKMLARHFLCKQFPKGYFKQLQKVLCNKALYVSSVHSPTNVDLSNSNWNPAPTALFFVDKGQTSPKGNSIEPEGFLIDSSGLESFGENQVAEPEIIDFEAENVKKKHSDRTETEGFLQNISVEMHSDAEEQTGVISENPADKCFSKVGKKAKKKASASHGSSSGDCSLSPDTPTEAQKSNLENLISEVPVTKTATPLNCSKESIQSGNLAGQLSESEKSQKKKRKRKVMEKDILDNSTKNISVEMHSDAEEQTGVISENPADKCFSKVGKKAKKKASAVRSSSSGDCLLSPDTYTETKNISDEMQTSMIMDKPVDKSFSKVGKKAKRKASVLHSSSSGDCSLSPNTPTEAQKGNLENLISEVPVTKIATPLNCSKESIQSGNLAGQLSESEKSQKKKRKRKVMEEDILDNSTFVPDMHATRHSLNNKSSVSLQLEDSFCEATSGVHHEVGVKGVEDTPVAQKLPEDFVHIIDEAYIDPSHLVDKTSPVVTSKKKKNRKKDYLMHDDVLSEGSSIPLNLRVGDDADAVCHTPSTKGCEVEKSAELLISPKCNSFQMNSRNDKGGKHIHEKKKGSHSFSETSYISEVTPGRKSKKCKSESFMVLSEPSHSESCKKNKCSPKIIAPESLENDDLNVPSSAAVVTQKKRSGKTKSNSSGCESPDSVYAKDSYQSETPLSSSVVHNSLGMKSISPSEKITLGDNFENCEELLLMSNSTGSSPSTSNQAKTSRRKRKSNVQDSTLHETAFASEIVHVEKDRHDSPSKHHSVDASHSKSKRGGKWRKEEFNDDKSFSSDTVDKEITDTVCKKKRKRNLRDERENLCATPVLNVEEEVAAKSPVFKRKTGQYDTPYAVVENTESSGMCDTPKASPNDLHLKSVSLDSVSTRKKQMMRDSELVVSFVAESSGEEEFSDSLLVTYTSPNKSNLKSKGSPSKNKNSEFSTLANACEFIVPSNTLGTCDSENDTEKSPGNISYSKDVASNAIANDSSILQKSASRCETVNSVKSNEDDKLFSDSSSDSDVFEMSLLSRINKAKCAKNISISNEKANDRFQSNSPKIKTSPLLNDFMLFLGSDSEDEESLPEMGSEKSGQLKTQNNSNSSISPHAVEQDNCKTVKEKSDSIVFETSKDTASVSDLELLASLESGKNSLVPVLDRFDEMDTKSHNNNESCVLTETSENQQIIENGSLAIVDAKCRRNVLEGSQLISSPETPKSLVDFINNKKPCGKPDLSPMKHLQEAEASSQESTPKSGKKRTSKKHIISEASLLQPSDHEEMLTNNQQTPQFNKYSISHVNQWASDAANKPVPHSNTNSVNMNDSNSSRRSWKTNSSDEYKLDCSPVSGSPTGGEQGETVKCSGSVRKKAELISNTPCKNTSPLRRVNAGTRKQSNNATDETANALIYDESSSVLTSCVTPSPVKHSPSKPDSPFKMCRRAKMDCNSAEEKSCRLSPTKKSSALSKSMDCNSAEEKSCCLSPTKKSPALSKSMDCNSAEEKSCHSSPTKKSPTLSKSVDCNSAEEKSCRLSPTKKSPALSKSMDCNSAEEKSCRLSPTKKSPALSKSSSSTELSQNNEMLSPSSTLRRSRRVRDCSSVEKENSTVVTSPDSKHPQTEDSSTSILRHSPRIKQKLQSSPNKNTPIGLRTSPCSKLSKKGDCYASPVCYSPKIKQDWLSDFPGIKKLSPAKKVSSSKICLSENSSMMDSKNHFDFSDIKTFPLSSAENKSPSSSLKTEKQSSPGSQQNLGKLNDIKSCAKSSPSKNTQLTLSPWKSRLRAQPKAELEKSPSSRNCVSSGMTETTNDDHSSNEGESWSPVWKRATKSGGLFPPVPKRYSRVKRSSSGSAAVLDQSLKELSLKSPSASVVSSPPAKLSPAKTPNQSSFADSIAHYASKSPVISELLPSVKDKVIDDDERPSTSKGPSMVTNSLKKIPLKSFNVIAEKIPYSCSKLKTKQSNKCETSEQAKERGYNLRPRTSLILPSKLSF